MFKVCFAPSVHKDVIWICALNLTCVIKEEMDYKERLVLAMTEAVTQPCPVSHGGG